MWAAIWLGEPVGARGMLDAPYLLSHFLMVASYTIAFGGTLLDNAHLFDEVSRLAKSDLSTRGACESSPLD